jgi:hypothetical protein
MATVQLVQRLVLVEVVMAMPPWELLCMSTCVHSNRRVDIARSSTDVLCIDHTSSGHVHFYSLARHKR